MSESTSWSDNIIFAMRSISILIVASAIRVAGESKWLNLIECAHESGITVEAELLSPTSTGVYEVWQEPEGHKMGKIAWIEEK